MGDDAVEEVFLQAPILTAVARGDAETGFEGVARGVVRPTIEGRHPRFVTTEVNIGGGEHFGQLVEDVEEELVGEIAAGLSSSLETPQVVRMGTFLAPGVSSG